LHLGPSDISSMSAMDPLPLPPVQTLAYESVSADSSRTRPKWVYAIIIVYSLLILGLISALVIPTAMNPDDLLVPLLVSVSLLVIGQVSLIYVPVRVNNRRPFTRRSLWLPLIGSGLLAGVLVLGACMALWEWWRLEDQWMWAAIAASSGTWIIWSIVFWMMSATHAPAAIASRLHRWLIAGSVLELLVAVPTHLIVRRRQECCAGIATMLGICMGVAVMLLAFGPSIGFLYYRRWKQVAGK
jgi:hypothetical protein